MENDVAAKTGMRILDCKECGKEYRYIPWESDVCLCADCVKLRRGIVNKVVASTPIDTLFG